MSKAFIFDMDGVIINSESTWEKYENNFLSDIVGKDIYGKIKAEILGSTTLMVYDLARQNGFNMDKDLFLQKYDKQAIDVYSKSEITKDIDLLIDQLISMDFKIGLVTASRQIWIDQVLPRLKNKKAFEYILSLGERTDLKPKPSPEGYLEAIQKLNSSPEKTIILEDSNKGLISAKATGALTICLREHLPANHVPKEADIYIDDLASLIKILEVIK